MNRYLLWSYRKHSWWRPDGQGYTLVASEAGMYDWESATRISRDALPGAIVPVPVRLVALHLNSLDTADAIEAVLTEWRTL